MSNDPDERERSVIHRQFDPDAAKPERAIVDVVAELEDAAPSELSPLYSTIDDVVRNVFSEPPAPEAQTEITFTYEGYRVSIYQDGSAQFVKVT